LVEFNEVQFWGSEQRLEKRKHKEAGRAISCRILRFFRGFALREALRQREECFPQGEGEGGWVADRIDWLEKKGCFWRKRGCFWQTKGSFRGSI
jgi:hypothetical protein